MLENQVSHNGRRANSDPGTDKIVATAWTFRRYELAAWAWERLVNRTDAWGGYRPWEEVGKEYVKANGTKDTLKPQTTRKGQLTLSHLARHFGARDRADLIGLHSTSLENTSLWGAVDIDWHGPTSAPAEVNWIAAHAWYVRRVSLGLHPLLTDSNGVGGFHLRILLAEPVPTPRVFPFLQSLIHDHSRYGICRPPETFPKQPRLCPTADGKGQYGNWLRLPGRHPTREHFSRVWDGRCWLTDHPAIDFLLSLRGDSPSLLPPEVPPQPPKPPRRVRLANTEGPLANRIAAYLRRLPNLGEGQGRDDVAFKFAAWLVRDLALAEDVALAWLIRWDLGNNPPKGETVLREILGNALRYGRNPIGFARTTTPSVPVRGRGPGPSLLRCTVEVW